MNDGNFPVLSLHRDDIRGQGFDPSKLTDRDMERMASKLGEALMDCGFWDSLDALCEGEDLPEIEVEDDD